MRRLLEGTKRAGFSGAIAVPGLSAIFAALWASLPVAGGSVSMVENGRPVAVIVTADIPTPTALYAAKELASHIEEATGALLPLAVESDIPSGYNSRIFVGVTDAAGGVGIEPDKLGVDEAVLRTAGADLYILGREDPNDNPLIYNRPRNLNGGTLFGVYEIIERYLGVIWAWPGELGRYVPQKTSLAINEKLDEQFAPVLGLRSVEGFPVMDIALKDARYEPRRERIAFSRSGVKRYGMDLAVYLRRHRMGLGAVPGVRHEFINWWNSYGAKNPEWFMMNEEGERGAVGDTLPHHVAMCVSNPDLHRVILEHWPGTTGILPPDRITLAEVDSGNFCLCPDCLAWDGPQYREEDLPEFLRDGPYDPRVVSDRYARFWKAVADGAVKRNPDVNISTYLYVNYFPAPAEVTELAPNIWGYFVPWRGAETIWFPTSEEALDWVKAQWKGWADTGMSMVYRPNYLHDGYTMPHLDTRQSGEMFKFAYEHGMKGAAFDSLCGEWSTKGPMLYMHMRLLARPDLGIDEILDEYYSVFGPAGEHVRAYFNYWEEYAASNMKRINELYKVLGEGGARRWNRFNLFAHRAYPPDSFVPAETILEQARQAAIADPNPEYLERVLFLKSGLEHAKLTGKLAAIYDGERQIPRTSKKFSQARRALQELVRFRRAHEHLYINDFSGAAGKELVSWDLNALFQ